MSAACSLGPDDSGRLEVPSGDFEVVKRFEAPNNAGPAFVIRYRVVAPNDGETVATLVERLVAYFETKGVAEFGPTERGYVLGEGAELVAIGPLSVFQRPSVDSYVINEETASFGDDPVVLVVITPM